MRFTEFLLEEEILDQLFNEEVENIEEIENLKKRFKLEVAEYRHVMQKAKDLPPEIHEKHKKLDAYLDWAFKENDVALAKKHLATYSTFINSLKKKYLKESEEEIMCEEVWVDADGNEVNPNQLDEAAKRAFKRFGQELRRYYRCTSGPKEGKLVSDPKSCAQRKDPRRVRHGKIVQRVRKGIRVRKTKIAKRQAVSRMVTRMNQRLTGGKSAHKVAEKSKSKITKSSSTVKPVKPKKAK